MSDKLDAMRARALDLMNGAAKHRVTSGRGLVALIYRFLRRRRRVGENDAVDPCRDVSDRVERNTEAGNYSSLGLVLGVRDDGRERDRQHSATDPQFGINLGKNRLDTQRVSNVKNDLTNLDRLLDHLSLQNKWGGP